MNLRSDNEAPAAPQLLEALIAANEGDAHAYGADAWTARLDETYSALFDAEVTVLPLMSGTAGNAIALAACCPPYGAVFCHEQAHVAVDECGAFHQYAGGAELITLAGRDGKLTAAALRECLQHFGVKGDHEPEPAAVTITQGTECGTVYRPAELGAIGNFCRDRGLRLHIDGARFANAVATLGYQPADLTHRVGVDIMSFGATKNGAVGAEAIIVFDAALQAQIRRRRMKGGHLLSKMRFVSAQLLAYVEGGLWLELARRANAGAQAIAAALDGAPGAHLEYPTEINEVFVRLDVDTDQRLREAGFSYHPWPGDHGLFRLVVPWNVSDAALERFSTALR